MKEKEDYTRPLVAVSTVGVAFAILQSLSGSAGFGGWYEGGGGGGTVTDIPEPPTYPTDPIDF